MSLNPPIKTGLHLGDPSVARVSAISAGGCTEWNFPSVPCGNLMPVGRMFLPS